MFNKLENVLLREISEEILVVCVCVCVSTHTCVHPYGVYAHDECMVVCRYKQDIRWLLLSTMVILGCKLDFVRH